MYSADGFLQFDSPTEQDWRITPSVPKRVLWADTGGRTRLVDHGQILHEWKNPIDALRWLSAEATRTPDSRWAGYLGYDLAPWFEPALTLRHPVELPLFVFGQVTGESATVNSTFINPRGGALASNFARAEYESAVAKAIEYIAAGDIFQVNLSQRFTGPAPGDAYGVYRSLLARHPARYGAYLKFGDVALISNSPELFLHVTPDRQVLTRPIKGTRPAAVGMEQQLWVSEKDQAELNMIVDLERNDLGRVCEIGSVRVSEPRRVERHPTVLHGVAGITGTLRGDVDFVELLRATFPGGSVTGAPKLRAMQIIDALEPCARGPYCGAIGYLAGDGSMQFSVAIRTMIVHGGKVRVPVGGGIVADSQPAEEFAETLVKARAMFEALGSRRGSKADRE